MSVLFFLVLLFSCTSVLSDIDNNDEKALLKLKKQLGDPGFLNNWVEGFQYCDSNAIAPDGGYIHIGCNYSSGHLSTLVMGSLSISAPFPDAICSLTELFLLEIHDTHGFYGSIPSCITKLPNLHRLFIFDTSFSGAVPKFYNHSQITHIVLPRNHFYGTIPSTFSTLPNLNQLDLSSNYLVGSIPPGLIIVPPYPILLLFNNYLTGQIPKCFAMVDFDTFDVSNNRLSGDASPLFGKQRKVHYLSLANNELEFDLSYVEFSDYTFSIDLSHNKIYGKVPNSFANAAILYYPDLSFNKLCGELPQGGNMGRFKSEVFANNSCLCGSPLPAC